MVVTVVVVVIRVNGGNHVSGGVSGGDKVECKEY